MILIIYPCLHFIPRFLLNIQHFLCFCFGVFHCQSEFEECKELWEQYANLPCHYCINLQVEVDALV